MIATRPSDSSAGNEHWVPSGATGQQSRLCQQNTMLALRPPRCPYARLMIDFGLQTS